MSKTNSMEAIKNVGSENRLSTILFFILVTAVVFIISQHPTNVSASGQQVTVTPSAGGPVAQESQQVALVR